LWLTDREIQGLCQVEHVGKRVCDGRIYTPRLVGNWREKKAGILLDTGLKLSRGDSDLEPGG